MAAQLTKLPLDFYAAQLADTLGAEDRASQQDVVRFMAHATEDMHSIMASYDHDGELVHSSAMIAAAHAYNALDYQTKIPERIQAVLNAPGQQAHDVREKIYRAIEGEYTKTA